MLASERSERDTLRSVQLRIVDIYIIIIIYIVHANFVLITRKEGGAEFLNCCQNSLFSVCGATPRFTAAVKIPLPGNISVLEFFSIESSLKALSSDYGSNKERNVHLEMRNLKQTELHRLKNRGKKG